MKRPTVSECLDEISRLRAENERLTRLVVTNRPELEDLGELVSALRSCADNWPRQLEELRRRADALLATRDNCPGLMELRGIWGKGHQRVCAALDGRDEAQGDGTSNG